MAYQYQEYPRHLYKGGLVKQVTSDEQKAAALADGWRLSPSDPIVGPSHAGSLGMPPVEPEPKHRGRPKREA